MLFGDGGSGVIARNIAIRRVARHRRQIRSRKSIAALSRGQHYEGKGGGQRWRNAVLVWHELSHNDSAPGATLWRALLSRLTHEAWSK
jgi:hypothetical protein